MQHFDPQTVQLIFAGAVVLALLVQAIALLAISFGARKAARRASQDIEELRSSIMPIVRDAGDLLARVGPRIDETTLDLAALIHLLRAQAEHMATAASEITERARRQASRLDSMISDSLDVADRAGAYVSDAVAKPLRQLSGILASARAIIESLRSGAAEPPHPGTNHPRGDRDMFV